MSELDAIYQSYPRHRDKKFALESIKKAVIRIMAGEVGQAMTRVEAIAYLQDRAKAFAESFAGQRGALTPYPATWMNRGGYMDDPEEWELITPEEDKQLRRRAEANVGVWRPQ